MKIVLFGEVLMRLAPPGFQRILQADSFEARFTGAEANVGVSLVNYGAEAWVVSRVPDNDIGQACVNYLRRFGLNTSFVVRGGGRLGLFFLETGASQRGARVIYDRSDSAMCEISRTDLDWEEILEGKDWFHFSGTAPALGAQVQRVLLDGIRAAKKFGLKVSCDLNYRSKLWTPESARKAMLDLVPYVDVLIGNEEDTEKMLGIATEGADVSAGRIPEQSYVQVAKKLVNVFGFDYVATTMRESVSASENRWSALLYDGTREFVSSKYVIRPIVDRVGAGDSFAGGLIFGLLSGFDGQMCIDFAAAASCLKHSIPGDFNLATKMEVETLLGGDSSGRVQR